MASLVYTGLANVWNPFFQIHFQGRDEHFFFRATKMLFFRNRQAYPEPSDCRNKEMFLTYETAAPFKLVVMLNEQAGVRFVAW
jgi:hypothetical protein